MQNIGLLIINLPCLKSNAVGIVFQDDKETIL